MKTNAIKRTLKKPTMLSLLSLFVAGLFMTHGPSANKEILKYKDMLGDNIPFTLIDRLKSER